MQIEFFFDIGSPYSYLAATQIGDLGERCETPVVWRPFLLGGLFKTVGNQPPAAIEKKGAYMLRDLTDWASYYGVDFNFSSHFPINSLPTQRALVAAGRVAGEDAVAPFALELYRAYWVEDRDVSQPDEIGACAEEVGLDVDAIAGAIGLQEVKDELRATTDEAAERGAFGAPTLFVGEKMFWGNDRLHFVEKYIEGDL